MIDDATRERARVIVSDTICTKARDQSRPLSAFIIEALEQAGFLQAPRTRKERGPRR